jgi:hypothetical protein
MSDRIATIHGVALSPGVSKNNRRYTRETIQRAHARLSARLADPNGLPVVMRTFHPATDGSDLSVTHIAGRVTAATLAADGALHFDADIPNTTAGRDVAALVTPDRPYLSNVSIRGLLVGEARTDNGGIEVVDDLEIDGIDYTPSPGVVGARITAAALAESHGRHLITESIEGVIMTQPLQPNLNEADHTAIANKVIEGLKPKPIPLHEMSDAEAQAARTEGWAALGIIGGKTK